MKELAADLRLEASVLCLLCALCNSGELIVQRGRENVGDMDWAVLGGEYHSKRPVMYNFWLHAVAGFRAWSKAQLSEWKDSCWLQWTLDQAPNEANGPNQRSWLCKLPPASKRVWLDKDDVKTSGCGPVLFFFFFKPHKLAHQWRRWRQLGCASQNLLHSDSSSMRQTHWHSGCLSIYISHPQAGVPDNVTASWRIMGPKPPHTTSLTSKGVSQRRFWLTEPRDGKDLLHPIKSIPKARCRTTLHSTFSSALSCSALND